MTPGAEDQAKIAAAAKPVIDSVAAAAKQGLIAACAAKLADIRDR